MFDTVQELINEINNSEEMPNLLILKNDQVEIFMQFFFRPIDGIDTKLFGLWNINVNEKFRNQGIFRSLIETLENQSYPVMVNDIVNPMVKEYLIKRGWTIRKHQKPGYNEVTLATFNT